MKAKKKKTKKNELLKKAQPKKRRKYVSPKQRAWYVWRREMREQGINLADVLLRKVFEAEWKGRPRLRARVQPTSSRPLSMETIVQNPDGSTTYYESHSIEQAHHRKRKKKSRWRTIWSKAVKGGQFSLARSIAKSEHGYMFSLGFTGGGHRAYLLLDKYDKQALKDIVSEDASEE